MEYFKSRSSGDEIHPFFNTVKASLAKIENLAGVGPRNDFADDGCRDVGPYFASLYYKTFRSFTQQYSYLLISGGAATVVGLIPMGKLSDIFGRKGFLVLGFGIFAVSLYFLPLSSSFYMAMIWSIVLGLSYSAVLPAWNALLAQHVPSEQQGLGWGIFSSVEGIGVIIGSMLGGLLAAGFGDTFTGWVSATLLGAIALFYFFYPFHLLQGK